MKIKIILEPYYSNTWPSIEIKLNNIILYNGICKPKEKYFTLESNIVLNDSNLLEIKHYGKKGSDSITDTEGNIIKDKAIMLKSISFDNYNIPEVILYQQKFYPIWENEPEFILNNLYFGYNGTYKLTFDKNVAKWYFKQLLEKERLANKNNKKTIQLPNGTEVESFEFSGKLISSENKENITIDELYNMVN